MTVYRHLLSPITIRGRTFRNRAVSTAHAPGYAENGLPGERYQAYHEEKAKGGIGLTMFGGSSNVSRDSGSIYGQLYVGDDRIVPAFQAFAERIHRHGAGLMCQITHMGRRTVWDAGDWLPTRGPSPRRDPAHHSMPYAMSAREIARVVRAFADAARRCRNGDLDGVEVLASSHLLGQFLSPLSNFRDDDYGGPLEHRARLLLEVVEACREAVGDALVLSVRYAADESNEDGLTAQEGIALARLLGQQGAADLLNVNGAFAGTDMGLAEYMPGMAFPAAPYVALAARVREASGLPVLQAARLSDPATADWAIAGGLLDLAGMTRPHMADPHLVRKLARGEEQRIRACVGAGYCLDRVYAGRDALCQQNVSTGRETALPHAIAPAARRLATVVVGGGGGGLEAARVLALRGHRVTLFEAGPRLGGQVLLAARAGWRRDIIGVVDWLAGEVEALSVDVRLNAYVDGEDVRALAPDVVVVATGGAPDTALPEGGGELALSTWDVLAGDTAVTGSVLVYDAVGGHAALSVADRLSAEGCPVTFVTPDRCPGRALGGQNYPVYLRNLHRQGVSIVTDRALAGITEAGERRRARLRHAFGRDVEVLDADTIVMDLGTVAVDEVFVALRDGARNLGETDPDALLDLAPQPVDANPVGDYLLFRIGDALAARDLHAALLDANRLCRAL